MMQEKWMPIPNYPGYEASDRGRIRSIDRVIPHPIGGESRRNGRVLRPSTLKGGYPGVTVYADRRPRTVAVHRLMAEAWIANPERHPVVRHLDDIPTHNTLDNLAWGTYSDNNNDTVANGHHSRSIRTHCPSNHPYSDENTIIDSVSGARRCATCRKTQLKEAAERYRRRKKMRAVVGPGVKEVVGG